MNKLILKIARYLIPLMPRGKSIAINTVLSLFGNKFGDMITLPDGRKFYINIISSVKRHLFFVNKYEERETQIVQKVVAAGDYVFDIGANFGWYTILMSKLVGNSGKVFAFELVPEIVKECKHNIYLNHLEDNITLENIAVGEENGVVDYLYCESSETGNFAPEMLEEGPFKTGRARMTSLDHYVEKNGIKKVNFIKCDIDGAEVPFLRGARKTLSSEKPVIIIEASERGQRAQGHSCSEIFKELSQFDYKFFSLRSRLKAIEAHEFNKAFKEDILCLPNEKVSILPVLARGLSRDESPRDEV